MTQTFWWLSFADETGNLGITIVQAEEFVDAVGVAHVLGINPGGEVRGHSFPSDNAAFMKEAMALGIGRLISRDEMIRRGYKTVRDACGES